jgi:hypothetical protein
MNRIVRSSPVVTIMYYNTPTITVIITHKIKSSTSVYTSRCQVADLNNDYAFTMTSLSVSWQRISTQKLSLQITMKSSCHFLFNHLGLPTPSIRIYDDSILHFYLQSPWFLNLCSVVSLVSSSWVWVWVWVWVWAWVLYYYRRSVGQSILEYSTRLGLTIRFLLLSAAVLLMWGALSDERTGLSFKIAAGPRQRSHFQVRVPWYSWPYFSVSDSRLPFSSPHPASTRDAHHLATSGLTLYSRRTDQRTENTASSIVAWRLCWGYHVIAIQAVHWPAGCCLARTT